MASRRIHGSVSIAQTIRCVQGQRMSRCRGRRPSVYVPRLFAFYVQVRVPDLTEFDSTPTPNPVRHIRRWPRRRASLGAVASVVPRPDVRTGGALGLLGDPHPMVTGVSENCLVPVAPW